MAANLLETNNVKHTINYIAIVRGDAINYIAIVRGDGFIRLCSGFKQSWRVDPSAGGTMRMASDEFFKQTNVVLLMGYTLIHKKEMMLKP